MSGSSESTSTTTPVYHTSPNALGTTDYNTSADLFNRADALTAAGPTMRNIGDFSSYGDIYNTRNVDMSPFSKSLEDAILNPQFGARNDSEQALLNSIMDVTAGRGAVSGLGAPTQSALATSIAPTMVDLNQKYVQNLLGAREGDIALRGQDIGLRGQDMERNMGIRGQDIQINAQQIQQWMAALQSLAELAGLAMPQEIVTSETTGDSGSQSIVEDLFEGIGKIF